MNAEFAALTIRKRYFGIRHLPGTGLVTELSHRFGQMTDPADMGVRKKSAVRVYRQCSTKLNPPVLDKRSTFALFAKSVVLQSDENNGGKAIIDLGNIHVGRRDSGHFEGLPRCPACGGFGHAAAGNDFAMFA